ncbi:MAG: murein biosynthesis integral membrane protein MurJ [Patescibacteria group bacterium]|nr:murein biosynthesis integral membrane protein MurJ [Patescibacteria group bacterium]MBU2509137.1 murein biosynthesis integral membrane protein MurJ [Patescibacteria group bacterium]
MRKFFSRLWNSETDGLTAAAFIVGGASLASRVVGVMRDRVLASTFGAGDTLDAYYAAFRLPDLLYTLIILGALSAGFIPVFAEYLETRSKKEAWDLAERALSVVGATMLIICAGLIVFAPALVPMTVPGFDQEKLHVTIQLARIMALSPFFLGLSAVMGGVLQATRRFLAFALAPVFYNLGIIFGALVLSPVMGIEGLAWGVVLGAFLHLITQASVALRLGLRRIPAPSLRNQGIRKILWLMAPRTAGLAVTQINMIVLLALASALPVGSIAVFNLANNLQSFPIGIFGISFAVAAFPNLARAAGAKRDEEFRNTLSSSARKIAFLIIPSTVVFFLLRAQIVRLVLGAGIFDWTDTIRTANVMGIFTASMLFQALIPLFARAFYALQDTWTPLIAGLVAEVLNLTLAITLRTHYGINGLAIAFSVAACVNMFLLWGLLHYRKGSFGGGEVTMSLAKTCAASLGLFGFGWLARLGIGTLFPLRTFWQVGLQATATIVVGGAAFVVVAWLLKSQEYFEFRHSMKQRFFKKVVVQGAEEVQMD